jgi:hypothetical protein
MREFSPPSSNPIAIYYTLQRAIKSQDASCPKIDEYKRTFRRLAEDWWGRGEISSDNRDDIITMLDKGPLTLWRPEVYFIPREKIEEMDRLKPVKARDRASVGDEFQIPDLHRFEFEPNDFEWGQ